LAFSVFSRRRRTSGTAETLGWRKLEVFKDTVEIDAELLGFCNGAAFRRMINELAQPVLCFARHDFGLSKPIISLPLHSPKDRPAGKDSLQQFPFVHHHDAAHQQELNPDACLHRMLIRLAFAVPNLYLSSSITE
jgi:hypothetical protein